LLFKIFEKKPIPVISILIAEDDADDHLMMQTALDETRFLKKIKFVENGIELLNYLDNLK